MEAVELGIDGGLFGVWFVHPWLIGAGLAAMVVPWAIHWFNRRRVRTVEWAAMRLLVGAQQRDASRVKIEDRALLALRMSWLLLAGLLVARPYGNEGPESTSAPTEFIVLLDDSRSMHAVGPDGSAFARARTRLIEWIEARSELGRDQLTVRLASSPETLVLDRTPLDAARRASAINVIERLEAGDERVDWPRTLAAARRAEQRESALQRVLLVVSDFRRIDWLPSERASTEHARGDVDPGRRASLDEGLNWVACDVGMPTWENLSIESLEADGIAADRVPVMYRAQVRNWGARTASNVIVELRVGETAPRSLKLDSIPAGEWGMVEFPVVLQSSSATSTATEAGIVLEARLVHEGAGRRDALPSDDAALSVAPGGEGVGVFFIEPTERGASADVMSRDLLARALAPDPETPSGFRVLTGTSEDWETWKAARVIVTSGESPWRQLELQHLEQWLKAGGTLILSPTIHADAATWNERWASEKRGLAPVRLMQQTGDSERRRWEELGEWDEGWAAARMVRDLANDAGARVKVFQWWQSRPTGVGSPVGVRVLGRLADPSRTPMLVERTHGRGRCWWLAVPLGESATDWPLDPAFVIFWQEALRDSVQRGDRLRPAQAGEALTWEAPIADVRRQASVTTQWNERWSVTGEIATESAEWWRFESPRARRSGVYRWTTTGVDGRPRTHFTVVHGAAGESDLRPLTEADARQSVVGDWTRLAGDRPWSEQWSMAGDGWTWLAWLAMIVLGVEQVFAWRIGRRRG